ncbi:hypothetical protein HYFRA_00006681 [Hymenoscyphus fraxineus]|uniref:Peptidase A1 domain-containing protein n=1 Tax=Hymenoscyphus fraxineus TaxID=746836 RepID=A0A9N9KTU0_9HELO|nr:hypothetical protein HYFRA_00006681 [Hymenoscyphus fraxineus]
MSSALPSPISVPTSQFWDSDNGGIWSTFILNIGSPPQPSRVIISTSSSETWVVGPQGCPQKYGSNCEENRGLLFHPERSTSWTANNNFSLFLEEKLGLEGNGQFGFDTVSLGYTGGDAVSLEQQSVAAIASPDYWFGLFGLDPEPSNFTNMNDPKPSFLGNLASRNLIPSLSWGYTAGANYRLHKPQGSLTLGGYDNSRFTSSNLTLKMYDDVSRRFIVDLVSITSTATTSSTSLLSQPISLNIDSTVPHLYLPQEVCERFEEAFGLVWEPDSNTYTVNATAQTLLPNFISNITFTLVGSQQDTLNITIPYSAFNTTVQTNTTFGSPKFPLKRAMNDTQYTLGRTFLQEAYLIADYQRSTFTISPCTWPSNLEADIKSIMPPPLLSNANSMQPIPIPASKSSRLSLLLPAIVTPITLSILLIIFYVYIRKRKKSKQSQMLKKDLMTTPITSSEFDDFRKPELDTTGTEIMEIGGTEFRAEIKGKELPLEINNEIDSEEVHEMPAENELQSARRNELDSEGVHELPHGKGVQSTRRNEIDGEEIYEISPEKDPQMVTRNEIDGEQILEISHGEGFQGFSGSELDSQTVREMSLETGVCEVELDSEAIYEASDGREGMQIVRSELDSSGVHEMPHERSGI